MIECAFAPVCCKVASRLHAYVNCMYVLLVCAVLDCLCLYACTACDRVCVCHCFCKFALHITRL